MVTKNRTKHAFTAELKLLKCTHGFLIPRLLCKVLSRTLMRRFKTVRTTKSLYPVK